MVDIGRGGHGAPASRSRGDPENRTEPRTEERTMSSTDDRFGTDRSWSSCRARGRFMMVYDGLSVCIVYDGKLMTVYEVYMV